MVKKILFQVHWFIGIIAGTLLMLVGLSGAILSFREELLDLLNPGVMTLSSNKITPLTPDQLILRIQSAQPSHPVAQVTVFADPHMAARVNFAPEPGAKRGELRYVNPVTGALLPALQGDEFFSFVERLHRWFLLPRDIGKVVAGSVALCLLFLALSGLYLRWPRRPLAWRNWTNINFSMTGRAFLWNLHSVVGTWALVMYLVFSLTGLYWAFDWFKDGANWLANDTPSAKQMPSKQADGMQKTGAGRGDKSSGRRQKPDDATASSNDSASHLDLTLTWQAFLEETAKTGGYSNARLRLPEQPGKPIQIFYLDANPPHERARNQMLIQPQTGKVSKIERYVDKSAGGRLIGSVYPLHMGSYFGLTGRIIMTLAGLGLPLFGITGWMLYLDRRRKKRMVRTERAALENVTGPKIDPAGSTRDNVVSTPPLPPLLIAFASQSGFAESIALRSAAALQAAGVSVSIQSFATLDPERLRHFHRVLLVASSFGEGDPPDSARRFARQLSPLSPSSRHSLPDLRYGILALGDSAYPQFCGFGHTLDHWLQNQGAQAFFPMIEVDNGDSAALSRWQHSLSEVAGTTIAISVTTESDDQRSPGAYQSWRLNARRQSNPGSQGDPIFHLEFSLPNAIQTHWISGALVEVRPRHSIARVDFFLQQLALKAATIITHNGEEITLGEILSRSILPHHNNEMLAVTAQQLADQLQPLGTRRYSIASIPNDGSVHLLVRQVMHEDGVGLASGWLTAHLPLGSEVEMRLLPNPAFELIAADAPSIFIGNGSGIAGLRGHLRARAHAGQHTNWLLFGERNLAHDFLYRDEIQQWLTDGVLSGADFAFSRDQPEKIYVQDRLRMAADKLRKWLQDGAVIYVCGSLDGMAAGIDSVLTDILGEAALDDLIAKGRYRRDVY
ncbi:sulfite reductase flavoprotein subunit alpha [Glaciimonas sp. CA11.2]|uniref:sulfite reductase flavoprotein subunit alpha n=1 Tax=Glaciimonas sp. CA11.2 TaxID=3048601 RepID=UPI002AB3743D|nr:sulfite reductase flavoprotein subunit alpha [Glaciimonas sp. CA11.2]MDY7546206.1 sulfite reductase flavoprotein subunit alpha [Glaciimonas sp. CA11.2]MEB0161736.1 sulfite reductase flavoprotein subunit alpha [Glaciimonas sp. CA11.2]